MQYIAKTTVLFVLFIHQILATEEQLNPYQIIYNAFIKKTSEILDENLVSEAGKKIEHPSSPLPENLITRKEQIHTKSFLWIGLLNNYNSSFFQDARYCSYDSESKKQRMTWRKEILFTSDDDQQKLTFFFQALLEIDIAQDSEMPKEALSKLSNLCCSFSTPLERRSILNDWRLSIEEENKLTQTEETEKKFLTFTENTLLEVYHKKIISLRFSDRLKTIFAPLSSIATGLATYIILNTLTPTGQHITNYRNISLINVSSDSLRHMYLVNFTPTFSIHGNQTFLNFTASTFDLNEPSALNPTVLPIGSLSLISAFIVGFIMNIESFFHQFSYFCYYCIRKNLEEYPKSMVQTLYEHSKQMTDEEKRKIYIKTMSDFIVDTFLKCWNYNSAINSCTTIMKTKLEEFKGE